MSKRSDAQRVYDGMHFGFELETLLHLHPDLKPTMLAAAEQHSCHKWYTADTRPEEHTSYLSDQIVRSQLAKMWDSKARQEPLLQGHGFRVEADATCDNNCEKGSTTKCWHLVMDGTVLMEPGMRFYDSLTRPFASLAQTRALLRDPLVVEEVEIVSPKLCMRDFGAIQKVLADVLPLDGQLFFFNNNRTSQHVHVSCGGLRDPRRLTQVCMYWWYFEPVVMWLLPHWRRNNRYAQPMGTVLATKLGPLARNTFFTLDHLDFAHLSDERQRLNEVIKLFGTLRDKQGDVEDTEDGGSEVPSRYVALNMMNLVEGGIGTLELRLKHGSTDSTELCMWIRLFASIVAAAITAREPAARALSQEEKELLYSLKGKPESDRDYEDAHAHALHLLFVKLIIPSGITDGHALQQYFKGMRAVVAAADVASVAQQRKRTKSHA